MCASTRTGSRSSRATRSTTSRRSSRSAPATPWWRSTKRVPRSSPERTIRGRRAGSAMPELGRELVAELLGPQGLATVLETVPLPIFVLDLDGRVAFANAAAVEVGSGVLDPVDDVGELA